MTWNSDDNADATCLGLPPPYNNFILSAPGSACMAAMWSTAREIPIQEIIRDFLSTGPVLYQRVHKKARSEGFVELPLTTTEIADEDGLHYRFDKKLSVPQETLGVHWHGSGYCGKYTEVTPENYRQHPSLIARMVTYALDQLPNHNEGDFML
jgi:hypothetical protein